jgi:hypothetical protein
VQKLKEKISFFGGNAIPIGGNITVFSLCEIQFFNYLFPITKKPIS